MSTFDYYATVSPWRLVHPLEKISYFAVSMILVFIMPEWPLTVGTTIFTFLLLRLGGKIPGRILLLLYLLPLLFVLPAAGLTAFSVISVAEASRAGMPIFFHLGNWAIAINESTWQLPLRLIGRTEAATSLLFFLALTTPFHDLVYILRQLKLPLSFIELLYLTYRFIFSFMDCAGQMYRAQEARNGYYSWSSSLRSLGLLAAHLWQRVMVRQREVEMAWLGRGYEGVELLTTVVLKPAYRLSWTRLGLLLGVEGLLVLFVMLWGYSF